MNWEKSPQLRYTMQAGYNSRPDDQLKKGNPQMHFDPSYCPPAFLLALHSSFQFIAEFPAPSPLVADGSKCCGTGPRMLPVCPPIEVIPLMAAVVCVGGCQNRAKYMNAIKSLLESKKKSGRYLISISCY